MLIDNFERYIGFTVSIVLGRLWVECRNQGTQLALLVVFNLVAISGAEAARDFTNEDVVYFEKRRCNFFGITAVFVSNFRMNYWH